MAKLRMMTRRILASGKSSQGLKKTAEGRAMRKEFADAARGARKKMTRLRGNKKSNSN